MITLFNDFHLTSARTRGGWLNRRAVNRLRDKLCPSWRQGCTCGGPLGERGPQTADILDHGEYRGIEVKEK